MRMLRTCLRKPGPWLMLLAFAVLGSLFVGGQLQPQVSKDSAGYTDFAWSPLSAMLTQVRTPAYPMFLKCADLCGGPRAVPFFHWVAAMLAVGVFYRGLRAAGLRRLAAGAASAALMLNRSLSELGAFVLPDSIAISMAIATCGLFFHVISPQPRWFHWTGFAAASFLTYMLRPAYLFLIPLWPLLSVLFAGCGVRSHASQMSNRRFVATVMLASLLPFVAYSSIRWVSVGHWGLVSFGGHNAIGVAGQFIDDELVTELSPELQPLAAEIVSRRAALPDVLPPTDFLTMEQMFNPTVWEISVPAAEDLHDHDSVKVNERLAALAKATIQRRRGRYLQWLIWNLRHAVIQVLTLTALDKGFFLAICVFLFAQAVSLVRSPSTKKLTGADGTTRAEEHLLLWTALAFCAGKISLVILVEPAMDRYMIGAMALLPAAAGALAAQKLQRVLAGIGASDRAA